MSFSGGSGSGVLGSDALGVGGSGSGGSYLNMSGLIQLVSAKANFPFLHQEYH